MRRSILLLFSLLLLLAVVPTGIVRDFARSVRPVEAEVFLASTRFDPWESTALFVGVRRFPQDSSLIEVRYAADDAVDLAYAFAMGTGERLVLPSRVVIALSGVPYKQESKERLKALKAAGARVVDTVDRDDLMTLLRQQAALAGRDGMVIVSFATHGFNTDGIPYLLSASSLFSRIRTTLSAMEITDVVTTSPARRSLIFFDACRERVNADVRGQVARPSAPLFEKIARVEGQVVFYAAAAGGYAHDDPARRNGAFTAAVIDALQCEPGQREMITVDKLATRVEKQVLEFLQQRDPSVRKATQISAEGMTRFMPLVQCRPAPIGSPGQIATAGYHGSRLEALDINGQPLWQRNLAGTIRKTFVEQLFREETRQVIVLSDENGGTTSVISIFDNAGNLHASYSHEGPLRYMSIAKKSWRHNPRIIVAGARRDAASRLNVRGLVPTVCLIEPKNTGGAKEKWNGAILDARETIADLTIGGDNRERTIILTTFTGKTIHLDFEGSVIDATTRFTLLSPQAD